MTRTVAVFTCEEWHSACAHLRVHSPLRAAGYTTLIGHALPNARLDLDCVAQADAVLIQRDFPCHAAYSQVIETAHAQGKRIVFEIDDALWDVPADHPAAAKYDSAREPILRAIGDADVITTTTESLAQRLRLLNPNTHVLPNCLDEQLWSFSFLPAGGTSLWEEAERPCGRPRMREAVTIAYLGGGTHALDLEMIAPALLEVGSKFKERVRFVFFGDAPPSTLALAELPDVQYQPHRPDYAQFAEQLGTQAWDIAIAPLRDTPFNRGKSVVKFLEYATTRAAVVCSDVAPYRAIVEHNVNGLLARDPGDWAAVLTQLIEQPELRQRLAIAARHTVQERWMLSQHAPQWQDAFETQSVSAHAVPRVSVIVLNHNGQSYLDDCLGSLSRLDYPPDKLDIVLADNGSADGSLALVQAHFPDVRVLQFDRNLGFCAGYNRAIAECNTSHVALLNNDMRVEPDWLIQLVHALRSEDGAVCAGSKILSWDGTTIDFAGHEFSPLGYAGSIGHGSTDLTAHDHHRYLLAASAGAMLIDRQIFIDAGGFDESYFAYYEDFDLGWRLWILGQKVVFAPRSIAYHRHFGTSSRIPRPKVAYLYERNALTTLIKNFEQPYLDKVLPVALMTRAEHAYLTGERAGLNMDQARMKPGTLPPPSPPQTDSRRFGLGYYAREARRTLKSDGALGLARRIVEELDRRNSRRFPLYLQNKALLDPALAEADIDTFLGREDLWHEQAQLAAMHDVIARYGALMRQRDALQRQRRRSDDEIFALTRCVTLRPWFDSPDYVRAHTTLIEAFDVARMFHPFAPDADSSGQQG